MTPRQGQDQWKLYKIVKVNGAYNHGRYEQNWSYSMGVITNDKVFAMQGERPARWIHLIT